MKLHREGNASIIITALLVAVAGILPAYFGMSPLFAGIILLPFVVLFALVLWFFRIPKRPLPENPEILYAPADGKVVVIENAQEPEYFKDERIQVSIFMSPLNVHQNTYPCQGKVKYTKYHKGKYLVAWHPKSSTDNERSTVVLETANKSEILFRQIAGAVARRICNYAKPGDSAVAGQEFGFIKFGSRVDIFLPIGTEILCSIGDKTKNKITPIAKLNKA